MPLETEPAGCQTYRRGVPKNSAGILHELRLGATVCPSRVRNFTRAPTPEVTAILETLAALGQAKRDQTGYHAWILSLLRGEAGHTPDKSLIPLTPVTSPPNLESPHHSPDTVELEGAPSMASQKQLDANRKNAQRSTGPRTPAGKAAVRFNALGSGIYAARLIIPGEDPEEFNAYAEELTRDCHPEGRREGDLVDQMIAHGWRLNRLLQAEQQAWQQTLAAGQNASASSPDTPLVPALNHDPQLLPRLQRLIASVQRCYHQASKELDRLQAARAKSQPALPEEPQQIPRLIWDNGFDPPIYPCDPVEANPPQILRVFSPLRASSVSFVTPW